MICGPGQAYPVCVAFRGDYPVEYWYEDDPAGPEPFSLTEVNRRLAALGAAGVPEWEGADGDHRGS